MIRFTFLQSRNAGGQELLVAPALRAGPLAHAAEGGGHGRGFAAPLRLPKTVCSAALYQPPGSSWGAHGRVVLVNHGRSLRTVMSPPT